MVLITQSGTETLAIGSKGPDFNLPATDGKTYSLASFNDKQAIVISFTCNHCPYAQACEDRYNALAGDFSDKGVAFLAINPNDAVNYPDDSFEKMKIRAREKNFAFPYLRDESQETAKAYGAVCTPHYFILNGDRTLVYEGRLDDNWKDPNAVTAHDLRNAIEAVIAGQPVPVPVPVPNTNPMGCSIKWR